MGRMFDAVNPANIPPAADGGPALRITVLGDAVGESFDVEAGNAPPAVVALAIAVRKSRDLWSVIYVSEYSLGPLLPALGAQGVHLMPGTEWPTPGVYLWCADPSGYIATGRWGPPVPPLAVQDTYGGGCDSSRTVDNFPATAAGYIDGHVSQWPAAAWSRFTVLTGGGTPGAPGPAPAPSPAPNPTPRNGADVPMIMVRNTGGVVALTDGAHKVHVTSPADEAAFRAAGVALVEVSDDQYNTIPDAV